MRAASRRIPGSGASLANAGSIVAAAGSTCFAATNLDNLPTGTITVAGNSPYGAEIALNGPVTLANHGTVTVGALNSSLSAGTAGRIENDAGTIANGGTVLVPRGATFVEGAGTTSGNPGTLTGALDLAGDGASDFETLGDSGLLSGEIAAGQTVLVNGSARAAASFTNHGTLIGNGPLVLPPGSTLTNEGSLVVGHGGSGSAGQNLAGNLSNTACGVVGEDGAGLSMATADTTLDNAGTIYVLFSSIYDLAAGNPQTSPRKPAALRLGG